MTINYENPAKLFLLTHSVESLEDVIAFSEFLRVESGLSSSPPINIHRIISRFGMQNPKAILLPRQEGTTIQSRGSPLIMINAGDNIARQKFSIAHELIELLFSELPGNIRYDRLKENIFGAKKENICQIAAANLLMPDESFRPRATRLGLSLSTAGTLAEEYEVSLMAATARLLDSYPKKGVVVLLHLKNKPSELKKKIPNSQFHLPGISPTDLPRKKLRVSWTYGQFKNYYLPLNKSIPDDSKAYNAWNLNQITSGEEIIPFGKYNVKAFIENKPITLMDEKCVLSLIR